MTRALALAGMSRPSPTSFRSFDAVEAQPRTLFRRFELTDLRQNQKRARLVEIALEFRVISQPDLA